MKTGSGIKACALISAILALTEGCASTAERSTPGAIAAGLDALFDPAGNGSVQISSLVVDLQTGEMLYARAPRLLLLPASTMKILSSAAAFHHGLHRAELRTGLGRTADHRTIALLGAGDPFLSRTDVAAAVRALDPAWTGFDRVVPAGLRFEGPAWGEGWMWDDAADPGQPPVTGLAIDGGCITVRVTAPENSAGASVVVEPWIPLAALGNFVQVGEAGEPLSVRFDRVGGGDRISVAGSIPSGQERRLRYPAPDPETAAAAILAEELQAAGRTAPMPAVGNRDDRIAGDEVITACSRRVTEVIIRTNKSSDNFGAECLLRLLGGHPEGGRPSAADGLTQIWSYLAGLDVRRSEAHLVDGSGVSRYNLVSADLLVRVLRDMATHKDGRVFRDSLPIAGVDGTLQNRMKGTAAEGRVRAKTGTLRGVSTLAGYIESTGGRRLAFAILIQNFVGPARPWRDLQDEACALLVSSI